MTIKHDRFHVILGLILLAATMALFFSVNTTYGIIMALLLGLFVFRYVPVFSKKLTVNENGCVVNFLWYNKQYSWEELTVKRAECYHITFMFHIRNRKGCVFSARNIRKPRWMNPAVYCFWFHPLSVFFVLFEFERTKGLDHLPYVYEVNESEFFNKMQEWNVEIQKMY